jgi:glyoxylase-like metal-dependent hydrolase (beta-lactamase superfamily II)
MLRWRKKPMVRLLRYHNTNCFFVESTLDNKLLAIDAGWPCTLNEYQREMKKVGLTYQDISWAMVTHFHPDHAGLITDFMADGVKCIVFEDQMEAIDPMETIIWNNWKDYKAIDKSKLITWRVSASRDCLRKIGISGEILRTNGHSPDSISFISDQKEVIIGDLYPVDLVMPDDEKSNNSWELILEKGGQKIFPSHANVFEL